MAEIIVNLRDDEDSSVHSCCDISGYFLIFAGNGDDVTIDLDVKHLQEIVDKLGEWGWRYMEQACDPLTGEGV